MHHNRQSLAAASAVTMLFLLHALLAATASAETGARYVKTRQGDRPKPIVAIDNVCAWPNLTVLDDGTIVATIFNQPNHGKAPGDVECWASKDNGQTWQKAGTPAPHDPDTIRMNVAAGKAKNGDLIVIASGWSNKYPPGKSGAAFRAGILNSWLCRSSDGGRTWSVDKQAVAHKAPDGHPWVPYGDIIEGDDGELRTAVYSWPGYSPRNERVFIIQSRDDGKTWGEFVPLDKNNIRNESAMLNLGRGKWLIAARHSALFVYASADNGKTWQAGGKVTQNSQHPGHLLRMKDGRILLTYGNRTAGDRGVEVLTSSDEGMTWSKPLRLVDWQGDGGYPSSVQLPDGQILTAYYARKVEGHDRYHMGVVTWDLAKSIP